MNVGTRISSVGVALPEARVSSAELESRLGLDEGWIETRTGIASRRVASDDHSVTSLAIDAANDALYKGHADTPPPDTILVATCTAEQMLPPVAPQVADGVGAPGIAAVDVSGACAGSLWALAHADALIASGGARRVLVVGSEILSRATRRSEPRTSVLFGDGAGALVVEAHDGAERLGPFEFRSVGSRPDLLWAPHSDRSIRMRGLEVYKRAVEEMTASARRMLNASGLAAGDVDLVVAHQANARILTAVAERLGLAPERMYSNIASHGNTSAASIPIALHEAESEGRLHQGDKVLLVTFGAGFMWGAGLITWSAGLPSTRSEREVARAGA